MQEEFLGETIRQQRLALGLTQEELCEGLCEPATLSRIENGKQFPSRSHANALLQRLNLPSDRYYALLSQNEAEITALQSQINSKFQLFESTIGEEKTHVRTEILEKIDKLKNIVEKDDVIDRQYILVMQETLGTDDGPHPFTKRLSILSEAISLTAPRFDFGKIASGLYSWSELDIINRIGIAYSENGQYGKANDIFSQLLTYIRKHYQNTSQYAKYLPKISYNYARELCLSGNYKASMQIAMLGQQTCLDHGACRYLPDLLAVMAECHYYMGEKEQSRELYYQAYSLYKVTDNKGGLAVIVAAAKEQLGLEFP